MKTALNMIGLDVGPLRLPLVEASEEERAVIREALERHNLLAAVCSPGPFGSCRSAGSARSGRT